MQSSAWRRRVQGFTCAHQVQNKAGEELTGLCCQFGCIHLQLLGSARTVHSVVVVPTSTDPMGILKSTREFKTPGAGKEHNSAVRGLFLGDLNRLKIRHKSSKTPSPPSDSQIFFPRKELTFLGIHWRAWVFSGRRRRIVTQDWGPGTR